MKKGKVFCSMEHIDSDLIDEAETYKGAKKKNKWVKWGTIAACLCLMVAASVTVLPRLTNTTPSNDTTNSIGFDEMEEAVGFTLSGNSSLIYFPISFDERVRFQLVPEGSIGLTPENTYQITEADLGESMGTVENCGNSLLIGKTVYHFAAYPDSNAICILDNNGKYDFYCADSYSNATSMAKESSSDALMALFDFPENCCKIEVQSADLNTLFSITDEEKINNLCTLLSGCENIGHEAAEKRFAQLWQDTYGNDNVYYSEADGHCVYRGYAEPEEKTYTDADGNSITEYVYPEGYVDPSDAAHELWNVGERCLVLETKDGLQLFIDYYPSIGVFFSQDGQFAVTTEKAESLNSLLTD